MLTDGKTEIVGYSFIHIQVITLKSRHKYVNRKLSNEQSLVFLVPTFSTINCIYTALNICRFLTIYPLNPRAL